MDSETPDRATPDPGEDPRGAAVEVAVDRVATGGEGVARLETGQVIFVPGVLPGEQALIDIVERKKSFARGQLRELLVSAPERIEPDCRHVADGCGGCDWRHVTPDAQAQFKAQIVRDVLSRIGRIDAPVVHAGPARVGAGRTTVRAAVSGGRAGYRARKSHRIVRVDECPAAHPLAEEILVHGRFGSADEITVRVGVSTGDRLVIVDPSVEDVDVPDGVQVLGMDDVVRGQRAWVTEHVGGKPWRTSAGSFFQTSPDGAEALSSLVASAVAEGPEGDLVDLYSGVGLLAGLSAGDRDVTAVEASASSVGDAYVNVPEARIIHCRVEDWNPQPAAVVVADPARAGLGGRAVDVIAATGAGRVVLVSCDPGALGRDAKDLVAAGYHFIDATTVDMFPNTSHVEVVSIFELRA